MRSPRAEIPAGMRTLPERLSKLRHLRPRRKTKAKKSALKVRMRYAEGTDGMTYYMIYHFTDGKLDSQEDYTYIY